MNDVDTFKKLPKNVDYLGKLIVAKGFKMLPKAFKCCPKFNKSPNLVTLIADTEESTELWWPIFI